MVEFFDFRIIDGVEVITKSCYKNGVNIKSTDMVNGKKHGPEIEFYESGIPKSAKSYSYGERNGLSVFYKEDGSTDYIETHNNGAIKSQYKDSFPSPSTPGSIKGVSTDTVMVDEHHDMLYHDKYPTAEETLGSEDLKEKQIKALEDSLIKEKERTSDLSSRLSRILLKYVASKKEVDILTSSLNAAENALKFLHQELDIAEEKLHDEENCFPTCAKACPMLKRAKDNLDLRDCIIKNMSEDMDELSDKLIRIKREVSEVAE